jgi:hypothetical protein
MKKTRYQVEPILKIGEGEVVPGGNAYIRFDKYIEIPGLENADISIEFKYKKEFHEVEQLLHILRDAGFTFVVQK